jgi:hypothetical protein
MSQPARKAKPTSARRPAVTESDSEFKQALGGRFFLRFHMTLILCAVIASGAVASKLLLLMGVRSMWMRFPLAVALSYGAFFLLIRVWLWYIDDSPRRRVSGDVVDSVGLIDIPMSFSGSGNTAPGPSADHIGIGSGDAGDFGGGGASDEWGSESSNNIASSLARSTSRSKSSLGSSSSSSSGGSGGLDLDGGEVLVLIVFAILLIAVFGAGAYLVYQAPAILAEAALQVVLASSLARASRRIARPGWFGSVFKATWIPFFVVLVLACIFGYVAGVVCPKSAKLAEVFHECIFSD